MPKLKHHFVPKLYLKFFASAPKRINLYNFGRQMTVHHASLRDQCYRHRFYGETDEVEDVLSLFESHAAPVLQQVINDSKLPRDGSEEQITLLFFVALQMLRTSVAAERLNAGLDKLAKQVLRDDPRVKGYDLDEVRIGYKDPALFALGHTPAMSLAISDLRMHLVCADNNQRSITSDSPVFKYNQYYETFKGFSMTGGICRGLQLFLPLSPKHLLFLYDGSVYRVGTRRSNISRGLPDTDIDTFNLLQAVGADENLYFQDPAESNQILELARKARRHRRPDVVRVEEFPEVGNEARSSLVTLSEWTPNLRLSLSFVSLQRRMRRISTEDKLAPNYRYRKAPPEIFQQLEEATPTPVRSRLFKRQPRNG